MAQRFTYDEFQRELTNSGLGSEFSSADLKLAQQNPDAGMSILKYKRDYHNATTPEQRALANLGAEGIRSSYGNYTGGGAGSQFYLDPLSPNSFQQDAKPTYSSNRTGLVDDLLNKQLNYGDYSYDVAQPEYTNRYDETIQDLLKQILNREAFSYDPERDQLYSQYRKQYTREGDRAQQNAIGAAAAASGGIPSSYAATAAAQAGDYYAAQMTDKIPELYQLAYNKYMNDYNMKLSDLGAVQGAEQSDYDKYLNELQQYNTNRNFDYQTWADAYSRIANDVQTASALEQLDYTKYLNELNQYNTDRSFSYQNLLDEINQQTGLRGEALEKAQLAARYGDYSYLRKLGIDTSAYEAALAAKGARSSGGGSGSGSAGGSKINGGGSYSGNVAMARDSYNGVQRTISTLLGQGNFDRAYDVAVGARGQMSKQQWSDVAKRIYEVSGIKIDDSVKYK